MFDDLAEVAKRRDYKLNWVFTKCHCGRATTMLLHSTEYDLQHNRRNIKQWCGWEATGGGGHLTRPFKRCSKCGANYEIEAMTCINCEKYVKELTTLELVIEQSEIEKSRLGRHLKKKKINDAQYTRKIEDLNDKIRKTKIELKSLSQVPR